MKKPPCCKYVKAALKWIWTFLIVKRELVASIAIAIIATWNVCIFWGWLWVDAIVLNPSYYYALPNKEMLIVLMVGGFAALVVVYALVMQHARSARLDCSIKRIHLSALAKLWLNEEQIAAQLKVAEETQKQKHIDAIESEFTKKIIVVQSDIARDFVQTSIAPFIAKFSDIEFAMLTYLLALLERYGNVPSVASKYTKDYDIKQFRYCNGLKDVPITGDGKTSYEILASYTLLEHSINVAKNIIEDIKNRTNTYSIIMPKAIVIALAHDIGKISKNNTQPNDKNDLYPNILDGVAAAQDHPYLSAMIMRERFPKYSDIEEVYKVISEHHFAADKNASMYAIALKTADHKARRQEVSAWFIKNHNTDIHPDPYQKVESVEVATVKGAQSDASNPVTPLTPQQPSLFENDQDKNTEKQHEKQMSKKSAKDPKFGNPPPPKRELGDQGLDELEFDLPNYEAVLFERIAALYTLINVKKIHSFLLLMF